MPLPPPSARLLVHTRRIQCQGFRREDGLWDIEGSLIDTRTEEMETFGRGKIAPGEHLHEMWIRMTVDADLTVRSVEGKATTRRSELCQICATFCPAGVRVRPFVSDARLAANR